MPSKSPQKNKSHHPSHSAANDLRSILNSPQKSICSLLQTYINKHPSKVPSKHAKQVDSALLKKLHDTCQYIIKKKNNQHLLVLLQILHNLTERDDIRKKISSLKLMHNLLSVILFQYLFTQYKKLLPQPSPSKKAKPLSSSQMKKKALLEKCLIEWLSLLSRLSAVKAIVEINTMHNTYPLMELLLSLQISLELRRELTECLLHLAQHASQKLQQNFFSNSAKYQSILEKLLRSIPTLGDVTSQAYTVQLCALLMKDKKFSLDDLHTWLPSDEIAKQYDEKILHCTRSLLRQNAYEFVLALNREAQDPTVFSLNITGISYGTYQPQHHRPHLHCGLESFQFEMSFPDDEDPSILEIPYSNLEKVATRVSGTHASLSLKLLENEEPELSDHYNPEASFDSGKQRVVFSMSRQQELDVFKEKVLPLIQKYASSVTFLAEVDEDQMEDDDETHLNVEGITVDNAPSPSKTKRFSTTPKIVLPRREVFSPVESAAKTHKQMDLSPAVSTPLRSKHSPSVQHVERTSRSATRAVKSTKKATTRSPPKKTATTLSVSPQIPLQAQEVLEMGGMEEEQNVEEELEDWEKLITAAKPSMDDNMRNELLIAPPESYARLDLDNLMQEEDDADSTFGDFALGAKSIPAPPMHHPVTHTRRSSKRKRAAVSQSLDEETADLHALFNQVHDVITKRTAKRRKLIENSGKETQKHVNRMVEESVLRSKTQYQTLESDYKQEMSTYRDQIAEITSEMRTSYSKFQSMVKTKTKALNSISKQMSNTKTRYAKKCDELNKQVSEDVKKLESEVELSLQNYEEQMESIKSVSEDSVKEVLRSFIHKEW